MLLLLRDQPSFPFLSRVCSISVFISLSHLQVVLSSVYTLRCSSCRCNGCRSSVIAVRVIIRGSNLSSALASDALAAVADDAAAAAAAAAPTISSRVAQSNASLFPFIRHLRRARGMKECSDSCKERGRTHENQSIPEYSPLPSSLLSFSIHRPSIPILQSLP